MQKFKRFVCVVPLIFSLMLCFAFPLSSFAFQLNEDGYIVDEYGADYYFQACYDKNGRSHTIWWDKWNNLNNYEITEDNGTFLVRNTSSSSTFTFHHVSYPKNPTSSQRTLEDDISYVKAFELTRDGTLTLFRSNPSVQGQFTRDNPILSVNIEDNNLNDIRTNVFQFAGFVEGELEVYFPIPLSGDITEIVHVDEYDVDFQAYQFDCVLTNNSNKNYQVMWCILDEGEDVNFDFDSTANNTALSGINGYGFNGNPSWVHLMNRWFCGFDSAFSHSNAFADDYGKLNNNSITTYFTSLSAIPAQIVSRIYGPCSWSYIGAGESLTLNSCVKNMQLYSGHNYTCKVYAIETPYSSCTNIDKALGDLIYSDNSNPYVQYLDFSDTECIYSSNFTMRFNTDFMEDWNGAGIISYSPNVNPDALFNSTLASNYSDGSTNYSYRVTPNTPSINPYGGYVANGGSDYSGSNKYSSLVKDSSNVFKFFSSVFGYFPIQVSSLYSLGFWAIIILAILRRIH